MSSASRDLSLLILGAALLYLPCLGARDLWNPSEPAYGQAVSEMAARGDWVVPTINGKTFAEKPILYFWLAGAAVTLGGLSELTLRLPSALAGIVSVLLLYLLVRPYSGGRCARTAATLLGTTYIVYWSARSIQMDLLLTACCLGAILAGTRALDHGWSPWPAAALAGACAGLGLLAKGPVGVVCPAMVLALYAAATRRLRLVLHPATALGALCCLLVAAWWPALLLARGDAGMLRELLVRQNFTRFLSAWDHRKPWWYFLQYFWIDMAPWSLFLPAAWGLRAEGRAERMRVLAWLWLVSIVLFFSLSASKRSPYILPAAPALAILVSQLAERWRDGRLAGWRLRAGRWAVAASSAALLAGAVAAFVLLPARIGGDPTLARAAAVLEAVLLLAGAGTFVFLVASRGSARFSAPVALLCGVVTLYAASACVVLPAADAIKSTRPFCDALGALVDPDRPLRGYRLWDWRAGYSFYTGRTIENLRSTSELRAYWTRPEPVYLIVERGMLEEAREVVGPVDPLLARSVGSNRVFLLSNRPLPAATR